jgi:hypothetical protein
MSRIITYFQSNTNEQKLFFNRRSITKDKEKVV